MKANRTLLEMKYARIIDAIAQKQGISREEAMNLFYNSNTFNLIDEGVADLHCRSDLYLADEVLLEQEQSDKSKELK